MFSKGNLSNGDSDGNENSKKNGPGGVGDLLIVYGQAFKYNIGKSKVSIGNPYNLLCLRWTAGWKSLCYYSNAVSLDLNAICSRYRYRYPIPAVDTLPDVPFSILQFAYLDRFPPLLLHCSQGMVLLVALYSATFGPARKLFAPWMKAGKSPPWKTVGKKKNQTWTKSWR